MTSHGVLVYDGDCGICQAASQWVLRHIDHVDVKSHFEYGVEALDKVWFVTASGRLEGAPAVSAALKLANALPYRLVGIFISIPGINVLARGVYWLIAKNRRHISRLFGLQACALPER